MSQQIRVTCQLAYRRCVSRNRANQHDPALATFFAKFQRYFATWADGVQEGFFDDDSLSDSDEPKQTYLIRRMRGKIEALACSLGEGQNNALETVFVDRGTEGTIASPVSVWNE